MRSVPTSFCVSRFRRHTQLALMVSLVWSIIPEVAARIKWADISPEDLAATESKSSPGSDSEILFSRHLLDNSPSSTWTENHVQAKIYTPKGVELASIFNINYSKDYRVTNIAARLVKPDGRSSELTKQDFRETTLYKQGGYEFKRVSFAFPNLQPGDVIEYSWTEAIVDSFLSRYDFFCQAEVPTREYLLEVEGSRTDFDVMWFNCKPEKRDPKSHRIVFKNLPPFVEEPLMPPETEFRGWITILFSHPYMRFYKNDSAWKMIGDSLAEEYRLSSVPNKAVRAKAAELIAGAATPEEQLVRLYEYARSMKNFHWTDLATVVAEKKKRDKEEESQLPATTMERGCGYPSDIDRLFAGLARAAGFEVRRAISADREKILNIQRPRGYIFTDRYSVAVKVGEKWKFFTPGEFMVPAGLLSTQDLGATTYVCDEKESWFEQIPFSTPDQTSSRRVGRFTLDDEGNLEGDVEVQLGGLTAVRARERWWNQSENEITSNLRETTADRLPTAELTEVKLENLSDTVRPLIIRYKVRVTGYASSIGSRIAFAPNYFEANSKETFTADVRRFPIFLEFARHEHDDVKITLPSGYMLDAASAPVPVGTAEEIASSTYRITYSGKTRILGYERDYTLGRGGNVQIATAGYEPLRRLLGRIHRSDTHQLMIKPKPVVAAPEAPAEPKL
jgi:hypothetical protein